MALAKRAWRATLAGTADDFDGDGGGQTPDTRKTSLAGDPGGDGGRPWRGPRTTLRQRTTDYYWPSAWWATLFRRCGTSKRGRRATLPGTAALAGPADDPGGDTPANGALALAKRAWRATLAGTADDPDGDGGRQTPDTRKTPGGDGGRLWRGPRTTLRQRTTDDWPSPRWVTLFLEGRLCGTHKKSSAGGGDGGRRNSDDTRPKPAPGGDSLWRATLAGGRPWRGRRFGNFGTRKKSLAGDGGRQTPDTRKRAWRATLAGTADDPGGARGRPLDSERRTTTGPHLLAGRRCGIRKKSSAGDPGGDGGRQTPDGGQQTPQFWHSQMAGGAVAGARWHSQKKLGATVQHIPGTRNKTLAPWRRPWRVRRTSRRGRLRTFWHSQNELALALAKKAWRDPPTHSQQELGGRPWRGRRTRRGRRTPHNSGTRQSNPGGDGGRRPWRRSSSDSAKGAWGPTWRGRRTTLTKTADDGTRKSDWRATLAGDWRALAKPAWWANLAAGTPLALARTTARRTRRKWTARTPARTTLVGKHITHGEVGEVEHKTRSSPASGGCGWVPRYEDGAIHDHSMGGARRGTVTNPKP